MRMFLEAEKECSALCSVLIKKQNKTKTKNLAIPNSSSLGSLGAQPQHK